MTSAGKPRSYCISLDDDPMIYKIIQEIVKVPTLPFVSGAKLLERAASYLPVAAFVDIHLEGGESGLEVLAGLRAAWPHTPILVMTSDHDCSLIGESLSLGANDFVRKPLQPDEVRGRVQARIYEMQKREELDCIRFSDIVLDRGHRTLIGPLGRRFLSETEWQILSRLLAAKGMVVAKHELKGQVWSDVKVTDNAVDRKLSVVRMALKDVSDQVRLTTSYGKGISVETIERKAGDAA